MMFNASLAQVLMFLAIHSVCFETQLSQSCRSLKVGIRMSRP